MTTRFVHFLTAFGVGDLDRLDLSGLAHSLHLGVHLADLPFRIGLFGPWGSGKTTIMRRVQSLLDEATAAERAPVFGPSNEHTLVNPKDKPPFVRTLWFNPWELESDHTFLHSLVSILASMIPDGVRYSKRGNRVVRQATESVLWLGSRSASHDNRPLDNSNDNEISDADRLDTLRHALRRLVDLVLSPAGRGRPRRLVVFVDDLDKCYSESVIAFLEGCKIFFSDDTRIVLVFALDPEVLSNAIGVKYSRLVGVAPERYIEKIFEFTYTVHPIPTHQLGSLVGDLYERSCLGTLLGPGVESQEREVIAKVLQRPGPVLNPRTIKRVFNKYIWFLSVRGWIPDGEQVDLELWLSWILVSEHWPEFRAQVALYGAEIVGELCNRVTGNLLFPHANEVARQALEPLPGYRALLEFFRSYFHDAGDMHTPEAQERLREMIDEFVRVDRTLRVHGL